MSCDPNWGLDDHQGHGTEMAGLALFGDLGEIVHSTGPVLLRHRLESVKFLPPVGVNPPELYGRHYRDRLRASLRFRRRMRRRVFAVATTTEAHTADGTRPINVGQPSSWSAAVDALAAGLSIETTADGMVFLDEEEDSELELFVISAGNVNDFQDEYLNRCDLEPVEDPAQAWNASTVGAHTELTELDPHRRPDTTARHPSLHTANSRRTAAPRSPAIPPGQSSPRCCSRVATLLGRRTEPASTGRLRYQRLTTKRRFPTRDR